MDNGMCVNYSSICISEWVTHKTNKVSKGITLQVSFVTILLNMVVEVFSCMMSKAREENLCCGVLIGDGGLQVYCR